MKSITFSVTNDLTYDQRMHRICASLAKQGYRILLIGRQLKSSVRLGNEPYKQKRLACFFSKGKLMYLEFNCRLFLQLLFTSTDCFCAIDLDTILPNYFASILRGKKRVYDAHELFTEQKEIVTRKAIHQFWLQIEKFAVPKFTLGYTVNGFIANELKRRYGVHYAIVRNLPLLTTLPEQRTEDNRFIICQGSVNEGRSFETLIPAMKYINTRLVICGEGNFFVQVQNLIKKYDVEDRVELKGMVAPEELRKLTRQAAVAVMLFENTGLNQYQSLANRFFDYIMAGVPQVCVAYPQYVAINEKYHVASLISDTQPQTIAAAINNLLPDSVYSSMLRQNCLKARQVLNWQNEEKALIEFYRQFLK